MDQYIFLFVVVDRYSGLEDEDFDRYTGLEVEDFGRYIELEVDFVDL